MKNLIEKLHTKNLFHGTIFAIWLGWAIVMLLFQAYVPARLSLARPDNVLSWTAQETGQGSQAGRIYLGERFLNGQVSWDSEFYLAIATGGYDNPGVRTIRADLAPNSTNLGFWPFQVPANVAGSHQLSLSYAFFPFYPLTMRFVALPLSAVGMNPIATATLAGELVSILGTLAAMLALYELARAELGDEGGLRAAFYLVIFPSGFFLAQVYSEGLFVGLALCALVLMRRGRLGWAALLAALATLTRAVGVALVVPMLISWIKSDEMFNKNWRKTLAKGIPWKTIGRGVLALTPLITFLLWRASFYGQAFGKVEDDFFSRSLFSFGASFDGWTAGLHALFGENSQAAAYYAVEWGAIILGITACLASLRRNTDLALFGLLVISFSITSGPAQGMHRYILAAPSVFIFLSRLGKNQVFDKVWTLASVLLMGVFAMLFTFNMWAG